MSDPATPPSPKPTVSLQGSCFCGSVGYTINGRPTLSAYCHCTNCQRLTGCPFVHTLHFPSSNFEWAHPPPHEAHLDRYTIPSKPHKQRCRCQICGTTVASYNSNTMTWSVWGAHLKSKTGPLTLGDWEVVKSTAHQFYGTRMLDVNDSLGKWEGYENKSTKLG